MGSGNRGSARSALAKEPEQSQDQQQDGESGDPHVPPRHPAEPSRGAQGEEPGQALEPLQTAGSRLCRTDIAAAQNRAARFPLFPVIKPPEIIGGEGLPFEWPEHRPNLDPIAAAGIKRAVSSADR